MTQEQFASMTEAAGVQLDGDGVPWAYIAGDEITPLVVVWQSKKLYPPQETLMRRYGLTPRQAHVAQLLFVRRTNEEIARLLGITIHTARRHVEAVLLKVGVGSRWSIEATLAQEACEVVAEGLRSASRRGRVRRMVNRRGSE